MKVLINYEPLQLISVCAKIKQEYKGKYDYENPPSGHLEELLKEISKLGISSLQGYAEMLKDYDVSFLAYHLPKEENIILNTKILKILQFRLNENIFDVYFRSWQKYYKKLANNLSSKNLMTLSKSGNYLDEEVYTAEIKSLLLTDDTEDVIALSVSDMADVFNTDVADVLHTAFNITQSSVLGVNVLKKIYLFCSEKHLIAARDGELCNICNAYSMDDKVRFLVNFVTKVSPQHYKNYLKLAELSRKIVNVNSTAFQNFPHNLKIRFQMWYSLIDIDFYFGEDERGVFWKARAIENNAIRVEKKSLFDMVIMYFEKFVVTEFLNKADGPIYIVSNDEFDESLGNIIKRASNKADLKSRMYHQYMNTSSRIQHIGDWRSNARRMINYLNSKK